MSERVGEKNNSYIWKIAGINVSHFMQLDSTGEKIIQGFGYEIFKILQDKLNFRYELVQPIPTTFGIKEKNGTWTGMTGQITSNKADMTATPLFITYDRFQAMDFPTTLQYHQIKFIVKIGGKESNWNSIIKPFNFELWVAVIIVMILTGIILRQVMKYESSNKIGPFRSFLRVIWYLFGTLTNKGGKLEKIYRSSSRFSVAFWLLSIVILVSSYSGKLMSFMTSPVFEFVPTNFDQLAYSVQNGKFACGTVKGGAVSRFLMSSKIGNAKILADHIISNKNLYNAEESTVRLLKGKYAFLSGSFLLARIRKSHGEGKLLISKDALVVYSLTYGLRKGFPYKKDFDKILSRLVQSGILDKFKNPEESVVRQITSEFRPLNIEDFLSPFVLLLIGFITSFICLIIELVIEKRFRLQIQY